MSALSVERARSLALRYLRDMERRHGLADGLMGGLRARHVRYLDDPGARVGFMFLMQRGDHALFVSQVAAGGHVHVRRGGCGTPWAIIYDSSGEPTEPVRRFPWKSLTSARRR